VAAEIKSLARRCEMALKITNDCMNCSACEVECFYGAIFPPGVNWRRMQNKYLSLCEDKSVKDDFYSGTHYYIVPDECTECKGISPIPRCIMMCPVSAIVADKQHWESEEHLYAKKEYLDAMHPWRSWM
jgi:ferredoxin